MTLLLCAALALAVLWVARLLHTGCARMLPAAGLLTGWLALCTPPGQALRAAAAEGLIVLTQIVAYALGWALAVGLLLVVMAALGRCRLRPGSPARWVSLALVLCLGLACALLTSRVVSAAGPVVHAAVDGGADAALRAAASVLEPEP